MMGKGGGIFMIIMLFMATTSIGSNPTPSPNSSPNPNQAITSTGSAECIAVSSLDAYDIYREDINPKVSGGLGCGGLGSTASAGTQG
jgi:hypothetical protein